MRASLLDQRDVAAAGYTVERQRDVFGKPCPASDRMAGWFLLDPEGDHLMIADHGCVAPTMAEAVAEGLERIRVG